MAKYTHVEGVVQIEVAVSIKVPANELVDFGFALGMEILKFVHGLELDHIKPVG